VLNGELVEDAKVVGDLDTAVDTKGLLVRSDAMEAGYKGEVQMHMAMEGTHDEVVVRYGEVAAYGEVRRVHGEVVEGNEQMVVHSVQVMHDAGMHDEAIGEAQARVEVVVEGSKGNVEDVQVHDAEVVRAGSEVGVQVNETLYPNHQSP